MEIKLNCVGNRSVGGVDIDIVGNINPKKYLIRGTTTLPNQELHLYFDGVIGKMEHDDSNYIIIYSDKNCNFKIDIHDLYDEEEPYTYDFDIANESRKYIKTIDELSVDFYSKSDDGEIPCDFCDFENLTFLNLSYGSISSSFEENLGDTYGIFEGCTSLKFVKVKDAETANIFISAIRSDLSKDSIWNSSTGIITIS